MLGVVCVKTFFRLINDDFPSGNLWFGAHFLVASLADKSLQPPAKGEQRTEEATNQTITSPENQCRTQTSKKNDKQQHGHK
ncbi:hypothetical protein CEXT_404221 [Caerostris extrusa]|uniref:Uncharacterized protein n=1 Tax=Caerostris extrusa TaxID=172846 RepID=A0AAV4PY45_CAEEX|nr:hypothetical protein CEXT_404221 [Caerostris extrusa]